MKQAWILLLPLLFLGGCTPSAPTDPLAALRTEKGTVVLEGEYEFVPPPPPWRLLSLDDTDYSVAFFRGCSDKELLDYTPANRTSPTPRNLSAIHATSKRREEEFFRRFLWAARVDFEKPRLEKISLWGSDALQAETVGHERVLRQKVLVRVLFAHRGERVVAFYFSQWRPEDRSFDRGQLEDFQAFVDSFTYLRPSFYQQL